MKEIVKTSLKKLGKIFIVLFNAIMVYLGIIVALTGTCCLIQKPQNNSTFITSSIKINDPWFAGILIIVGLITAFKHFELIIDR